jgi:UDP-N-acetylmuramoylalanine--D-glutamate ligase
MQVLVIGLAATGEAVARHCAAHGATVVVIEDTPSASAAYADRVAALGELGARLVEQPSTDEATELAAAADLVVPSPGVPERHAAIGAARRTATPVRSEIDLAAELARSRTRPALVAVTGTNGKTTVTTLTAAMLGAAGTSVAAAGNIGRPLLAAVTDDVDVVVAEVSSFQLALTTDFAPRGAALLNLGADHLDWHRTFDAYAQAKAKVFAGQGDDDLLVFNADDPVVAGLAASAPGRRVPVSVTPGAATGYRVAETASGALLVGPDGDEIVAVEALALRAPHDLANALSAAALATDLGADREAVASVLTSFTGLEHRTQLVADHDGVRWVDDSKATNPHATVAAVRGLHGVVLLAGGRNKGLDLSELRALTPRLRAVVAIGESGPEVAEVFEGEVPVVVASSMSDAVHAAAGLAQRGDTVLLSPACASFDWYPSYAARGDDFAHEVRTLLGVQR